MPVLYLHIVPYATVYRRFLAAQHEVRMKDARAQAATLAALSLSAPSRMQNVSRPYYNVDSIIIYTLHQMTLSTLTTLSNTNKCIATKSWL